MRSICVLRINGIESGPTRNWNQSSFLPNVFPLPDFVLSWQKHNLYI